MWQNTLDAHKGSKKRNDKHEGAMKAVEESVKPSKRVFCILLRNKTKNTQPQQNKKVKKTLNYEWPVEGLV